jgi:hypothetical protein
MEFAMMQPPLSARITSTRPSKWVWRVSLDGKRVGTVYGGDTGASFTARDIDFHLLGRSYPSAEAAMLACVAVVSTVTSLQRADGRANRRSA